MIQTGIPPVQKETQLCSLYGDLFNEIYLRWMVADQVSLHFGEAAGSCISLSSEHTQSDEHCYSLGELPRKDMI